MTRLKHLPHVTLDIARSSGLITIKDIPEARRNLAETNRTLLSSADYLGHLHAQRVVNKGYDASTPNHRVLSYHAYPLPDYMIGALTVARILEAQAAENGTELPELDIQRSVSLGNYVSTYYEAADAHPEPYRDALYDALHDSSCGPEFLQHITNDGERRKRMSVMGYVGALETVALFEPALFPPGDSPPSA